MSTYRITTYFSGSKEGWSESFCSIRSTESPGEVANQCIILMQKRAQMLGTPYQIDGFRVAKIRDAGDNPVKRIVFLAEQVFKPSDQSLANGGDFDAICLITHGTNAVGDASSDHFVGGPPDSACDKGGEYNPDGNGIGTKFGQWATEMISTTQNMGWMNQPPSKDVMVTGYAQEANMTVTLTSDAATWPGPFPGPVTKVRCRGINGGSTLNGQLLVIPKTATTCTTIEKVAVQAFVTSGFMKIYATKAAFIKFAGLAVKKIGNHKRGKPFFVTPGRAKKRVRI